MNLFLDATLTIYRLSQDNLGVRDCFTFDSIKISWWYMIATFSTMPTLGEGILLASLHITSFFSFFSREKKEQSCNYDLSRAVIEVIKARCLFYNEEKRLFIQKTVFFINFNKFLLIFSMSAYCYG